MRSLLPLDLLLLKGFGGVNIGFKGLGLGRVNIATILGVIWRFYRVFIGIHSPSRP